MLSPSLQQNHYKYFLKLIPEILTAVIQITIKIQSM